VRRTRALLFDFNGVLVEDETHHWRAFRAVVAPLGIRLGRVLYNTRYLVFDDRTALLAILRDARVEVPSFDRLLLRKRRVYARLARRVRVDPRAARLVRLVARRVPVAVVSGAARREILSALRRARLAEFFAVIVAAEDVPRPKPWPDGYRLALRRLGLRGGRGVVAIEDAPGGVRAARAAGCAVIGVATTFGPAALRRAGAGRVVRRLRALRAEDLLLRGARTRSTRRRS
jgi:HAD superfamily hydrolase (TIGR01509 family)